MDFEHDVLAENGIRACLTKPVSIPLLRDTCARLLEEDAARGDETRREDKTDAGPGESVTGARVLLVEDNDINQEIARSLLEEAGVDVDVARNGAEAVRMVERADEGAYRMVFMDIQMPVMDGLEAARRIRAQGHEPEDLPIVAMTAHAQSSDREKSLQAGMNDHLVKPLDPEEVRRSLRAWIKNAPALPRDGGARPATGRRDAPEERRNGLADVDTRDIPGLSQAAGLESVGGNRVLYAKLLRRFQISCRDTVRDIRRALELADEELAVRLAHTVKGVSASLGFMALSRAAAVTEKALKDKEPEFTLEKTLLPVFGDELERALAAVDIYLEALPAAEAADNLGAVCELPRRELHGGRVGRGGGPAGQARRQSGSRLGSGYGRAGTSDPVAGMHGLRAASERARRPCGRLRHSPGPRRGPQDGRGSENLGRDREQIIGRRPYRLVSPCRTGHTFGRPESGRARVRPFLFPAARFSILFITRSVSHGDSRLFSGLAPGGDGHRLQPRPARSAGQSDGADGPDHAMQGLYPASAG